MPQYMPLAHSPALATAYTCAVRGEMVQLPAVARRWLYLLTHRMRPGRKRGGFFSQLLSGGEYAIMKQPSTPPHPLEPLPQTPASRYLPDIAPDIAIIEIHWSVLLLAGANSSRGKKAMRRGRHHVEAVNPPKHHHCRELSPSIPVLTTPGRPERQNDRFRRKNPSCWKSLE